MSQDQLFDPLRGAWTRVSPSLATLRMITRALPLLVVAVVLVVIAVLVPDARWWIVAAALLLALGAAWTAAWSLRNQRSWGYSETEDELLITSGVMFRRLVAVPYGRMQFVDVQAGPIERSLGIANVSLHTASSETAATIPGVPSEEAARLRNRLTELGEARGAGV